MISWLIINIQFINTVFAIGGLGLLLLTTILGYDYLFGKQKLYTTYISQYVWILIVITSWAGVASTLLYSEVFGFVPCSLCWLQRVALYPQAIIALAAYKLRDNISFPIMESGFTVWISGCYIPIHYQALNGSHQQEYSV